MKHINIFIIILVITFCSCDLNRENPKTIHQYSNELTDINCDYKSLIRFELDRMYKDYEIIMSKVSDLAMLEATSKSTWFIVVCEVQVADVKEAFEFAFFISRQCGINSSINLSDLDNNEGLFLNYQ